MPEPKPAGELKPFTPTPKPVGELRPFNASSKTDEKYYKALSSNLSGDAAKPKDESQFIDKLEFDVADPNNEGKKSILKELAQRGASQEIINNSILTLQGKHPKQQGGFKYYIDEFGIPNPISNNERPPEGYDIASVWGTKKQAQDDNFITNLTKHVWNGIIGTSKGAVALGDMAQGLITGSPSEKAQGLQNSAEYLKFETKDFNPVYTGKEYWDLLKPEKYSFNAENITGNIMQGMESVITFALGAKGIGTVMKRGKAVSAGAKGVSEAAQLTSAQQIAANATSAYNMALSESIDDAKDAGLQGRNIYSFAAVSAIPQAALEVAFGPEAMLLKNQFAQAAKSEFKDAVKQAAKKIERDINGNITKESLDLLSKEMAQEATKLSLKYRAKEVAKNVVGESATEGIQQFADESSKQLYDKLSSDPKFNADAFSPEAVNKIVNATIAGALGSFGPSTAISMSKNKTEFEDKKSKQVFNTVLAGDDSIKAFKKNVYKEQQEGNISPEEANDAIIRLNSYKEYNDITTSSKLNIDTEKKREVFDKTFQKQNLESEIANFGDPAKLHPLKLAEHNSLVKQSNDLQKEIDAIILESSIKKSPTVANKTIADVKKQEEKRTEVSNETNPDLLTQIKNKFKKPSEINRKFEDFPVQEYNTTKNHKLKHEITSEWLSRKNKEDIKYKDFKIKAYDKAYGNVTSRKFSRKNENNSVLGIELPDGKKLRFASSMLRMYPDTEQSGGFRGNFRQERFNTEFPEGTPIGIRVYEVEDNDGDTSKHIKAFRKDNGKFIGWMKSTNRGTFTPDVTQKEQLDHIETIKEVDDGHEIEFNEPVNKPVKQLKVYEGSISKKEFSDFKEGSGRSTETVSDLENIEALLKDKELSKEDRLYLKDVRAQLLDKLAEDKAAFRKYKKSKKQLKTLSNLVQYSLEELTELYKTAKLSGKKEFEEAKNNIAQYLNKKQLETLRENDKFIEDNVDSEDMSWAFLWTGALSEVSEKFPIIQALNNTFRERSLNQIEEANSLKRKHEKLGKAVIKEKNGKLGLVTDLFSSDSAKYFEYLDEDGHLRTNTDNLTKAQIEYLEFVRELTKDKIPDEVTESQLLKIDPGFREVYRNEGLMPAINSYINKTATDKDVTFYNPETKKEETASYLTAQKKLVDYAKKNPVKGIYHLIILSKQAKPEKSNHYIKKNGQLTSRFDQPRPKDKGYSKDFYKAVNSYIEDKMHIKYMADVVPIVDSVESFYKNLGFEKEKDYKNTLKFLEEWKARQLYQESIKETDSTVDKALSVLRHFTSLTVMGFNVPANIINLAIGNYNTIREDGFKHLAKGQARLFLGKNRAGYGAVNKYALDILKKFNVVNIDSDSNPRATAGKLLSQLAFIGMKTGEINIQGSEFLGHLTDAEYDSFEYDEDGELQIKESLTDKEKADLKQKINEYKTKVSNVQGKYSDKDARNFMRFEAGRSAAQFKLWMFDWFRTRFGKEIINSYGESERGSLSKSAIKEFKDQLLSGNFKDAIKSEDFRKNLYGAIVIGTLLAATHGDDDDNEIRKKVISLNKALEQILFIYDIDQAKYLLSSPAASIMTIVNFLDALKAVWDEDEKKFKKSGKKLVPYNKASNLIPS